LKILVGKVLREIFRQVKLLGNEKTLTGRREGAKACQDKSKAKITCLYLAPSRL
jgi:hypothetical protein